MYKCTYVSVCCLYGCLCVGLHLHTCMHGYMHAWHDLSPYICIYYMYAYIYLHICHSDLHFAQRK